MPHGGDRGMSDDRAAALALLFGVAAMIPAFALAAAPRGDSRVAVVAWPWAPDASALKLIAAAGSRMVAEGPYSWLAIAQDQEPGPGLVDRLYEAGAMMVLNADFVNACVRIPIHVRGKKNDPL